MRYEVYDGGCRLTECCWPEDVHGCSHYRVMFIISRDELEYDISNMSFVQGDVARVADNYGHDLLSGDRDHLMHQWKGVCEPGNIDRVRKVVRLGLEECKRMLHKYTRTALCGDMTLDNCHSSNVEYLLELMVPSTFSGTTCEYLMDLVHEYLVSRALSDWASITFPEGLGTWEAKRQDAEKNIRLLATSCGVHHQVKPSII